MFMVCIVMVLTCSVDHGRLYHIMSYHIISYVVTLYVSYYSIFLDGGAAGLAADHQGSAAAAVHEDRKVLLVLDLELLGQQDRVGRLAGRAYVFIYVIM